MSDVDILCVPEDEPAGQRLAAALESLGLCVRPLGFETEEDPPPAKPLEFEGPAIATLLLWSRNAATSNGAIEWTKAWGADSAGATKRGQIVFILTEDAPTGEAAKAVGAEPPILLDAWLAKAEPSFDASEFISLLTILDNAGKRSTVAIARALALRDADLDRLRASARAQDEALSTLTAEKLDLEKALKSKASALSREEAEKRALAAQMKQAQERHDALSAEHEALAQRVRALSEQLRSSGEEYAKSRALLDETGAKLQKAEDEQRILDQALEEARSGLAGALRQQKTLQGQIDADDQTIRHIMTQREELIQSRERLEKERLKLAQQISDAERRLTDSEQRRETYVAALVERKKEIDLLSDKLAASESETAKISGQADTLRKTMQDWRHVPWRGIAAGGLAAGVLLTVGTIFASGGVSLGSTATETIAAARPETVAAPPRPVDPPLEQAPKSEAKVAPDTLQVVDTSVLETSEASPSMPAADTGVIPIPDESGAPAFSDNVQFNPAGLPPVDPYSRPPPQDLPPMQQKPRLLLKPQVPPPPGGE